MKLSLHVYNINGVSFADKTEVNQGKLSVNRDDLVGLLAEDMRLKNVSVELAAPGEKCRILRVGDVIEPRAKIGRSGQAYPGAVDNENTVGRGETSVLRGAAVVISEYWPGGAGRPATTCIDMWGEGAEAGPYGKTCNIVVMAQPSDGTSREDYRLALKIAALKASACLAGAAVDSTPDSIEEYNLPPAAGRDRSELPGVVYIFQIISLQFAPMTGEPVLYGDNVGYIVPTIIHPNEILDGALTSPYSSSNFMDTYAIQNHPMILELYRNHGKTLDFRGVIITNAPNNAPEFERTATIAANMAKFTLNADGAILTKCGGGAPELVMARTAQKCEQLGIKTTLALLHMGLDTTEITAKASTIFSDVPEVDAMVSMGTPQGGGSVKLETADRLIGQTDGSENGGEVLARQIRGALSQLGDSSLMMIRY